MLNTKTLRNEYRKERQTMRQNQLIGLIILLVLGASLLAVIVRLACYGISLLK
jgi:hypothetical protein